MPGPGWLGAEARGKPRRSGASSAGSAGYVSGRAGAYSKRMNIADVQTGQPVTANDKFTVRICDPIGDGLLGADAWPDRNRK